MFERNSINESYWVSTNEFEWCKRLENLENQLERDAENVYELSSAVLTGVMVPIADGDEANKLVELADSMLLAKNMIASIIANHYARCRAYPANLKSWG